VSYLLAQLSMTFNDLRDVKTEIMNHCDDETSTNITVGGSELKEVHYSSTTLIKYFGTRFSLDALCDEEVNVDWSLLGTVLINLPKSCRTSLRNSYFQKCMYCTC